MNAKSSEVNAPSNDKASPGWRAPGRQGVRCAPGIIHCRRVVTRVLNLGVASCARAVPPPAHQCVLNRLHISHQRSDGAVSTTVDGSTLWELRHLPW
jgi:hypothetical protein